MTPAKQKAPEQANGVVPQPQVFNLEVSAPELQLVHLLLTNVPLQSAEHKWAGAQLQVKIEQLAQAQPDPE